MFGNFDEMQKVTKASLDATAKSFEVATKNVHVIATEITDYTKRSFEHNSQTLQKLLGAKSLDKVVEVQSEFAKATYEDYFAQAAKLGKIYSDLGKEALKPYEDIPNPLTK
jgi:hypothetical protein